MDTTATALNLMAYAARNGYASAVELLEGYIEDRLTVGSRIAVRVLLAGADAEDMQEWLADNE